jgi:putative sigma-54 modulation protein
MQITIKCRNIELTDALNDFVQGKFSKLDRQNAEWIKEILITLSVEKLEQKAEAVVQVVGETYHTEAVGDDLYAAVDVLLDKVVRIIVKHKEKLQK